MFDLYAQYYGLKAYTCVRHANVYAICTKYFEVSLSSSQTTQWRARPAPVCASPLPLRRGPPRKERLSQLWCGVGRGAQAQETGSRTGMKPKAPGSKRERASAHPSVKPPAESKHIRKWPRDRRTEI